MDVDRLRFAEGRSMVVDCLPAGELPIDIGPRAFCHAGPPLDGAEPSPPLAAAAVAGLLIEGQADTPAEARALLAAGAVRLTDNHSQGGVGALAGLVTPHIPVFVVEHSSGRRTYAPLSDGRDRSIRFGMHDPRTLENLRWCSQTLAPMLSRVLSREPVDVGKLLATSLLLGDEGHNRCDGAGLEIVRILAPSLAEIAPSSADFKRAVRTISENPQFTLPMGMAAAKGLADDLHRHGPPGIVTAACGNGTDFGLRISGAGDRWFRGDAYAGTFTPLGPFTRADMAPILGDSAIMEVAGLGSQAISAAPALVRRFGLDPRFVGGLQRTAERVCVSRSPLILNPHDDFRGTPVGISAYRVVREGLDIMFTMGFLGKGGDGGRVGMGIGVAPGSILAPAIELLGQTRPGQPVDSSRSLS